jgi:hypothetical protein
MMKNFRCAFLIVFVLFLLVSAFDSQEALAQVPQDLLKSIPSDVPSIFVINMQRFAKSPFYAKIMREKQPMNGMIDAISSFSFSTGVDLANDLSYLVLSSTKQGPVMVASGRFSHEKIGRYLRCSMYPKEMKHQGVSMLIFPAQASGMGVAMISPQLIAVGRPEQLKAIINANAGKGKSVMSNPKMAAIIGSGPSDEMIWFAGISGSAMRNLSIYYPPQALTAGIISMGSPVIISSGPGLTGSRLPEPIMMSGLPPSISITQTDSFSNAVKGSLEFTDAIAGKVSLTATSLAKADELMKGWNSASSGNMPSQNASTMLMTRGLAVNQNQTDISLLVNVSTVVFETFWKLLNASSSASSAGPIPFLKPMPPLTEEALKAKLQATMRVSMLVRKDGTTENIRVLKNGVLGMEQSAITTITDFWRFLPALGADNRPIEAQVTIDIPITYEDNKWK